MWVFPPCTAAWTFSLGRELQSQGPPPLSLLFQGSLSALSVVQCLKIIVLHILSGFLAESSKVNLVPITGGDGSFICDFFVCVCLRITLKYFILFYHYVKYKVPKLKQSIFRKV